MWAKLVSLLPPSLGQYVNDKKMGVFALVILAVLGVGSYFLGAETITKVVADALSALSGLGGTPTTQPVLP